MTVAMPATRRPGSWIPWLFVGFFLLVLAVNAVMIWIALTSWTGLATNRPYDRGLTYNRNLDAAARQAALGWRPVLAARIVAGEGLVELTIGDAADRPVAGAAVVVRFERPTSEGMDFAVALEPVAPGTYRGRFVLPAAGVWDLHATARRGEDLFVHEQRVVLP
jgi:nitrogen fixation protein FixH